VPRRQIQVDGVNWTVAPSGHYTQYNKDEFTVVFQEQGGDGALRVARYSPLATKQREDSLASLSDRELLDLFHRSQPSWTTPETGYRR
jgi:hypothetical protein